MLHKSFQTIENEGKLSNYFYEARLIPISEPDKDGAKKWKLDIYEYQCKILNIVQSLNTVFKYIVMKWAL